MRAFSLTTKARVLAWTRGSGRPGGARISVMSLFSVPSGNRVRQEFRFFT